MCGVSRHHTTTDWLFSCNRTAPSVWRQNRGGKGGASLLNPKWSQSRRERMMLFRRTSHTHMIIIIIISIIITLLKLNFSACVEMTAPRSCSASSLNTTTEPKWPEGNPEHGEVLVLRADSNVKVKIGSEHLSGLGWDAMREFSFSQVCCVEGC